MKKRSITTWQGIQPEIYPRYAGEMKTDVVIVGGGIAGTTTAYLLAKAGKKVVVLDKGDLFRSVTAYTTAFLTRSLDSDLSTLKNIFGKKAIKQILGSHEAAIDLIESIVKEEKIDCEFCRVPNYMVAFTNFGMKRFKKEAQLSIDAGFDVEVVPAKTFPFKNKGGILFPNQGKFHPLKYVSALRERAKAYGAKFFDNSKVLEVSGDQEVTVRLESGSITASSVVIATYNPFSQPWWYVLKKGTYISYVFEVAIKKGTLPYGIFEDDDNPYHYFRVDEGKDYDRMIIGGEDHRKEIPMDRKLPFNALKKFMEKHLGIRDYRIIHQWAGPILEQTDGLALIGRESDKNPNRYCATAFSGNGMTYGIISGMIISDLILGKGNPWEDIYDPTRRIRLRAVVLKGRDYIGEFVGGMIETLAANMKFKPKE